MKLSKKQLEDLTWWLTSRPWWSILKKHLKLIGEV